MEKVSGSGHGGEISGTLQSLCDLSTHTVTASSEDGRTGGGVEKMDMRME